MSSFSKFGLARVTGRVFLGSALLGSLVLTGCSAPASNEAKSDTTASASASSAPQFDRFKSEAFDLTKQVSTDISSITNSQKNIFLGDGVVGQKRDGDKVSVVFMPYEEKDKAWTYTPEAPGIITNLMRWKGKSYIVVLASVKESKAANGMQAGKETTTEVVVVLDAATGKVVNTLKGEPTEVGKMDSSMDNYYLDNIIRPDESPRDKDFVRPFMVGLVYATFTGDVKLVDPVTGATVATDKLNGRGGFSNPNNETGFLKDLNKKDYMTNNEIFVKGIFENFALMEKSIPSEDGNNTGGRAYTTFYLLNTVTGETVSTPMKCGSGGHGQNDARSVPVHSPNFRYVKFAGNYVFDTQTGKSFCDTPKENKDMRHLPINTLDNEGNMYGLAQRDYLRVSLADPTKAETLVGDVSMNEDDLPIVITDKGSAVFWMDDTKKNLVTVPVKTDPES